MSDREYSQRRVMDPEDLRNACKFGGEPMQVYVAGPMRGVEESNKPLFDSVSAIITMWGAYVYNPASYPLAEAPKDYIPRDLKSLYSMCPGRDVVVFLPGYLESVGARAEMGVAHWVGLDICLWPGTPPVILKSPLGAIEAPKKLTAEELEETKKLGTLKSQMFNNPNQGKLLFFPKPLSGAAGYTEVGGQYGTGVTCTSEQVTRTFASGATRDADTNKLDYEGFLDPLVLECFAEYMHFHREMKDGTLRASDNWQKGIPPEQLMKSLLRHVMELWISHRTGAPPLPETEKDPQSVSDVLCAIMFNTMGLLREEIQGSYENAVTGDDFND